MDPAQQGNLSTVNNSHIARIDAAQLRVYERDAELDILLLAIPRDLIAVQVARERLTHATQIALALLQPPPAQIPAAVQIPEAAFDDFFRRLGEVVNRPLEEVRNQMRADENHRFSQCESGSYTRLLQYFRLQVQRAEWDMNAIQLNRQFEMHPFIWQDDAMEADSYLEICEYFQQYLPPYVFKSATGIQLSINYFTNGVEQYKLGRFDIFVLRQELRLVLNQIAMMLQTLCAVEIKLPRTIRTPATYARAVRQTALEIISLLIRGNINQPFGLLTDMEDIWTFVWIDMDGKIHIKEFVARERGLTAFRYALDFVSGQNPNNGCPMINRMTSAVFDTNFPPNRQGNAGEGVDVANMADFYDTMTDEEIFQHRMKLATRMIMGEA